MANFPDFEDFEVSEEAEEESDTDENFFSSIRERKPEIALDEDSGNPTKPENRKWVVLQGPDAYADGNLILENLAKLSSDLFVNPDMRCLLQRVGNNFDVIQNATKLQHVIQASMVVATEKETQDGPKLKPKYSLPTALPADILERNTWPNLRHVRRIARFPLYVEGFELFKREGYDKTTETFGTRMYTPTPMSVEDGRALLCKRLTGEFPFLDEADRANAIAMALTPLVLPAIRAANDDACVPVFLIDASTQGTGKTILAQSMLTPQLNLMAVPKDEAEFQKMLGSIAGDKREVLFLDNIPDGATFGYPTLAALTTQAGRVEMRRLGVNEMINGRFTGIVVLTGNNIQLDVDARRRTVLIQLQASSERPEERTGFKLDLPQWAKENRADVHGALVALVEHWKTCGRPQSQTSMGSNFGDWSRTIGGILEAAGIGGFLGNMKRLGERVDDGGWRDFTIAFGEAFQGQNKEGVAGELNTYYGESPRKLIEFADANDIPLPTDVTRGTGADRSLGKRLKQFVTGRKNLGGFMWEQTGSKTSKRTAYRVVPWETIAREV